MKCFTKSGITRSSFSIVHLMYEVENPFDDLETREELHDIFDQISSYQTNCPVEKYINRENDGPTYMQYEDDWEDNFFTELGPSQVDSNSLIQEDFEDDEHTV